MVLFFFWLFLGAMGCWQTSCFESQAVYVGFWDLGSLPLPFFRSFRGGRPIICWPTKAILPRCNCSEGRGDLNWGGEIYITGSSWLLKPVRVKDGESILRRKLCVGWVR